MGARSSGSESSREHAALLAPLLTEQSLIAHGTLVDDGRLRQMVSEAELEFVGRSLTEAEAMLAARVRAIGLCGLALGSAVHRRRTRAGGLQAGYRYATEFPPVVVGVGASTRR